MHELSLADAVLDAALRNAEGRRVLEIRMRIGALRQVVPDTLVFYFGFAAKDTLCDGARIAVQAIPARLRCRACGDERELGQPSFRCSACNSSDGEVVAGRELEIESIVLEEAVPCTEGS